MRIFCTEVKHRELRCASQSPHGYTATKRIRALTLPHCRTIPIIAMTANALVEDQEKAVEAGMNGYQAKPIQVSELLKTIESVL